MTNILKDSHSYIITTPNGTTYRCARSHLKYHKPYNLPTSHATNHTIYLQARKLKCLLKAPPLTTYKIISSKCPLKQISAQGNHIEAAETPLRWIYKCNIVTFLYELVYKLITDTKYAQVNDKHKCHDSYRQWSQTALMPSYSYS